MTGVTALSERFSDRSVLITGGLGFIGSNLARALVAGGARVKVVDALIPGYGGLEYNLGEVVREVELHIGDVRDPTLMKRVAADSDVVFSLAGQTSHLDSMRDPYTDLEHNCRGPLTVLEGCRTACPDARVVFASTRQIYGRPQYLPVDEAHPIAPVDVNGVHKAAGEHYHLLYHRVHGMAVSILRLTNTFGPRMRVRDERQTFLGWWIQRLLTGHPLEVFGDGLQRRDFSYVDDTLRAMLMAALDPRSVGEIYNVADLRAISLLDLAKLLVDLNDGGEFRVVPFPTERLAIDIGDYIGDCSRIRRDLGWEPAVSLEDGLARTIDYFREHGEHYWKGLG